MFRVSGHNMDFFIDVSSYIYNPYLEVLFKRFKINIGFNSAVLIYVTIYMKLAFQASVNPIAKMVEHA